VAHEQQFLQWKELYRGSRSLIGPIVNIIKSSWTGTLCIWLSVSRIVLLSFEWFLLHTFLVLFFLTAQNHGAECSLSRNLPRPSHFIVRDNDQLRYSAPLLLSSPLLIPVAFPLSISTNDAAHKFVHDHPQKALLSCSDYVRRLFGSLRRVLFRGILRSQSAGESVCESVRAWAKSSERIFKKFLNCSVRRTVR